MEILVSASSGELNDYFLMLQVVLCENCVVIIHNIINNCFQETSAREVVMLALKEFGISDPSKYVLVYNRPSCLVLVYVFCYYL